MIPPRLRVWSSALFVISLNGLALALLLQGDWPTSRSIEQQEKQVGAVAQIKGELVFAFIPSGAEEPDVFASSVDGSSLIRLTTYPGPDHSPAWSPDHSSIAFVSDRDDPGNMDLYVLSSDGKATRITTSPATESGPVWAPDGSRIAFERTNQDGHPEIFVVDLARGAEMRITDNDFLDVHPEWSPDGSRLVVTRNVDGNVDLYLIDIAARRETRLTDSPGSESSPAWSPYEDVIAYVADPNQDGIVSVERVRTDGVEDSRIVASLDGAASVDWSPDGRQLILIALHPRGEMAYIVDSASGAMQAVPAVLGATVDW